MVTIDTSSIEVGDADPFPGSLPSSWCRFRFGRGWMCTAPKEHLGKHVAAGLDHRGVRIMAVAP